MPLDLQGTGAQKIRGAYNKSLGRAASDDEVSGWLSGSFGGGGEDDWVNQIGQSHEAQSYLASKGPPTAPVGETPLENQQPQAPAAGPSLDPAAQLGKPVEGPAYTMDGAGANKIRDAYAKMLGRDANDHEVSNWLAGNFGWGSGESGVEEMLRGIANSGEAQDYRARTGAPMPTLGPQAAPPPPPPTFQPPAPPPVAAPVAAPAAAPAAPAPAAPAPTAAPAAPPAAAPATPTAPAAPPQDGGGIINLDPRESQPGFGSTPAAPSMQDDVTRILRERLNSLSAPQDVQSDPIYQNAMKAYQVQQLRGADQQRAAAAERMAAEGTLSGGGFNTTVNQIKERQGENEAQYGAGLALDRSQAREQKLMEAIALARQFGQDDIANSLEQQRLALSQEIGRGDLALRGELGRSDLGLRTELGRGQLNQGATDLELRRLLGMGGLALQGELGRGDLALRGELGRGQLDLGYGNLGQSYAQMVANANRDAVLAAL